MADVLKQCQPSRGSAVCPPEGDSGQPGAEAMLPASSAAAEMGF